MVLRVQGAARSAIAEQRFLDLYHEDDIPLPRNYLPMHPFDNGEMTVRDERLAPWPRTPVEVRRHLHEYYAVISGLDFHIGRLLAKLADRKVSGETIIVFTSDHGLAVGSHGLFGKQNLYEHSMRVPLVFDGPGIQAGSSDALVYLLDLLPDALRSGRREGSGEHRRREPGADPARRKTACAPLGTAYRDVQRAVRNERWKLIRYPQVNRTQLFDLQNDPDEMRNLADDPGQAERIARMTQLLQKWQGTVGDRQPLVVDNPRPAEFVAA